MNRLLRLHRRSLGERQSALGAAAGSGHHPELARDTHHAADIDDTARDQLRSDVLVLDDDLATLHALLTHLVDWAAAYERLLAGEVPPHEDHPDNDTEDQ